MTDAISPVPGLTRVREVPIDPLVLAAQGGDDLAFAALYDAYAGRTFALCLRLSGDSVLAAELVQDVFVRVWERLSGFRGESAFATWLHRIAVNTVLDSARQRRRRRLRVAIAADFADITLLERSAAPASEPSGAIDLEAAIAQLPAGARAVFVLFDLEGFGHDEIAGMLDIAVGTSKAHLFRARRLLRGMLER